MNDHPTSVMIFAAGFGTRMGALTKDIPKPLIPVAGQPLIDRALLLARAVNPTRIIANLHYRAEQLADHLAPKGVILSQEPEILETGGGLKAALPLLGAGPVYTMNPDVIWQGPNPLTLLRSAWSPDQMDALLVCVPVARTLGHEGAGDFSTGADNRIRRGSELIYGGVQIVKTDGLDAIAERAFSLNVLWDRILAKNRLYCAIYPGRWCDLSHPKGIHLAQSMLAGDDV